MQKNDHLFLYVMDHGGTNGNNNSYICLWNNERLQDYELADMLAPFTSKYINVNVVLGQCNGGGFIDDLTQVGCVVATAATGRESSWSCRDKPFDEFVYQWTCAINEADHRQVNIVSDADENGRVTMDEAFRYAQYHDGIAGEHPQYNSTPISIGEDLAFNNIPSSVSLYIKDNEEDTGKEPNLTTDKLWLSPSIWIRNKPDSIEEHENPIYTPEHETAYVYVKVHNRGKETYTGGKWLQVYWAQASTGLTIEAFRSRETYNGYPTGGPMDCVYLESPIPAGDSTLIRVKWLLPTLLEKYPNGEFHFCLVAKLIDKPNDDPYIEGVTGFDVQGCNYMAQKNVSIVKKEDLHKAVNVFVRNVSNTVKSYTLEFVPRTSDDEILYNNANVEFEMSSKIFAAWGRGGFQAEDIEIPTQDTNSDVNRKIRFVSPKSKLKALKLYGNDFDIVSLKFNFTKAYIKSRKYTFDLIQKDENGVIIGGETFIIESPTLKLSPVEIYTEPIEDGKSQLTTDSEDFCSFMWLNNRDETISETESVIVTPKINDDTYKVIALSKEGEMATGDISFASEYGIKNMTLLQNNEILNIELFKSVQVNSSIVVASISDVNYVYNTANIENGCQDININISKLASGIYSIIYKIEEEIIDIRKINIK